MTPPTGFHKWRWRFIAIWIVVFTLATAYGLQLGRQAHTGLCGIKANTQAAYDESVKYLKTHPDGLVSQKTGEVLISAAQIQATLDRQAATLVALKDVSCS